MRQAVYCFIPVCYCDSVIIYYFCIVIYYIYNSANKVKSISVAGLEIPLSEISRNELKGVLVDDVVRFHFYRTELGGAPFVLLVSKLTINETPAICSKISYRLSSVLCIPIVFYFPNLKFYERQRYIEKEIFFITGRGEVYLPNMILHSKRKQAKKPLKLSASAQFLLLYHLQKMSLEGLSVTEIASKICQYSYVSIAKAVENIEALDLCKCAKDADRSKRIRHIAHGRELWEKAEPYMVNPVNEVKYCDSIPSVTFQYAGVSALSSYTMISADETPTLAVYSRRFKESDFQGLNDFDGNVRIEIWRYPEIDVASKVVDKLSLFLSLEGNSDPRVDKENKIMFNALW